MRERERERGGGSEKDRAQVALSLSLSIILFHFARDGLLRVGFSGRARMVQCVHAYVHACILRASLSLSLSACMCVFGWLFFLASFSGMAVSQSVTCSRDCSVSVFAFCFSVVDLASCCNCLGRFDDCLLLATLLTDLLSLPAAGWSGVR
ncbi:hypothetical protein BP00DRAFT_39107 [Aspergillus indologenus CBS 114.80]|uniref:Uncharacterized protein n=1 Tax=Aspergillus indologenus CBS 114.80 TaxID=1450541 RepID=A0A2V5IDA1_9EURO|nr:hypothetical protein BP00DRAFT_39107 [Aspergillus indologenus CBS 114.80]